MKKLILLPVICILGYICQAQEAFVEFEGEYTEKKIRTGNDFVTSSRYTRFNRHHLERGYFLELASDANTAEYTAGLVCRREAFSMIEGSLGLTFLQEIRSKEKAIGGIGKILFATKCNKDRAIGKIRVSATASYSKFDWWYQVYATISPRKWVSIGLQLQRYSVHPGLLMQINFPGVIKPFISIDGHHQRLIGLNISSMVR